MCVCDRRACMSVVPAGAKVCVLSSVCMLKKSAFSVCEPLTACDLLVSSAAIMVIKSFVISRSLLWPLKVFGKGGGITVCLQGALFTKLRTKKRENNKRIRMSELRAVQEADLLLAVVSPSTPAVLEGADQLNMMDSGSWFAICAM